MTGPIPEAAIGVRDARYDILFEPVQLGPVRARNRFFQVPHCNGMGYRESTAQAAMRNVKAEAAGRRLHGAGGDTPDLRHYSLH